MKNTKKRQKILLILMQFQPLDKNAWNSIIAKKAEIESKHQRWEKAEDRLHSHIQCSSRFLSSSSTSFFFSLCCLLIPRMQSKCNYSLITFQSTSVMSSTVFQHHLHQVHHPLIKYRIIGTKWTMTKKAMGMSLQLCSRLLLANLSSL